MVGQTPTGIQSDPKTKTIALKFRSPARFGLLLPRTGVEIETLRVLVSRYEKSRRD
jgi:hypothetical protein